MFSLCKVTDNNLWVFSFTLGLFSKIDDVNIITTVISHLTMVIQHAQFRTNGGMTEPLSSASNATGIQVLGFLCMTVWMPVPFCKTSSLGFP
jgi:hypothetical protein